MLLIQSSVFKRHKRSLDVFTIGNPGYVYLISRFDDDDSTICTFGSLGYRTAPLPTGIGGVAPVTLATVKRTAKLKTTDVVRGGFSAMFEQVGPTSSVIENAQQGGGHAEEIFIRKLPQMFDEFGAPRKIDLFISRIPCATVSTPWILSTPDGDVLMPTGCGNKLNVVIRMNERMTWRIWWEHPYPNVNTQSACLGAMAALSGRAIVQRYTG